MTTCTPRALGIVELGTGRNATDYAVRELPADFGRGFTVERLDTLASYAVHLDGRQRSCECMGFLRHGHCKHADGLAALVAAGRL